MPPKKRPAASESAVVKRQKKQVETSTDLVMAGQSAAQAIVKSNQRHSKLHAPTMLLSGSPAEVLTCRFSPNSQFLASAGKERDILLWNVYSETCDNWNVLNGHKNAVTEVCWSRDNMYAFIQYHTNRPSSLYSSSVDKTVAVWDAASGERIKQLKGHGGIVNAVSTNRTGSPLIASASDDGFIKVWDPREKRPVANLGMEFPMTAVDFSHDGTLVFGGGVDNVVRAWDIRKRAVVYGCKGHGDTITCLRTSPDGNFLLSNSMDNTLRIWDVKPFAATSRFVKSFEGAPHGFEKYLLKSCWSPDESHIASGAADRSVMVWDVRTKAVRYKLPGHRGVVTQVDWSSKEPILASCSTDKMIYLGELDIDA